MFEKSFSLIRTNPALTGNVKVVVNSNYNLFLESFPTTKTLSNSKFQHYAFQPTEYYKEILPFFFNGVEETTIFYVKNADDASVMYSEFQHQFDHTYSSGASRCEDAWYKEEYEYFAPLHLKKEKLPTHFIVLRLDGAGLLNSSTTIDNFRAEVVNQWKFVHITDLQEGTPVGSWLNQNFVTDDSVRNYPLYVNHESLRLSEVFGIDVKKGGWATKYLNLSDVYNKNTPIFKTEEFFTNVWQDNSVIYPNIINFKFLFDDTPATPTELRPYSINRYVGFYADEMKLVKQISPYKGFELNKVDETLISTLSAVECSQIPYVKDNLFVREVEGKLYSFDPIKNGWVDIYEYWVEFGGKQCRVQKQRNTRSDIIGAFLYKIISDTAIEFTVTESEPLAAALLKRVLINDLSSFSQRVTITAELNVNELTARNVIGNTVQQSYKTVKVLEDVAIEGIVKKFFRLDLAADDATAKGFAIDGFSEADLHLMQIGKQHFVIKRYDNEIPGLGGMYYLHTDYAVEATENIVHFWINNGLATSDPAFYTSFNLTDSKLINSDGNEPLVFNIYRINFTDIKDFDFDRVYSDQAAYEYEKSDEVTPTLEPKMYAKEYRSIQVNMSGTDADSRLRRLPILDMNNRAYNQRAFNGDANPFTNEPYKASELYQQTYDGSWRLFDGQVGDDIFLKNKNTTLTIPRKYYREEHYILRFSDSEKEVDFKSTSLDKNIAQDVTWGVNNIAEVSDPVAALPALQGADDPNNKLDNNYVPVSSEYVQSDELWEVRQNTSLSPIWNKSQSVCKWAIVNSKGAHDNPYRLNYSLDFGGLYNYQPNIFSGKPFPVRPNMDLDYFYRFGGKVTTENYTFTSLHLRENNFDSDAYLSTTEDYFEKVFRSDQVSSKGILLTEKYSGFISDNKYEYPYTVFRGLKYYIQQVDRVAVLEDEYNKTGKVVIDEIITSVNPKFIDYRFAVVFGRKLSGFSNNPGNGDNNMGIDVYVNDVFKNVVIHVYIDTDNVIEVIDSVSTQLVDVETCPIDVWYQDNIENQEQDTAKWASSEFSVNSAAISLRARDIKLSSFVAILDNINYEPTTKNKNKVQFIHCYADGSIKKMSYVTTDFIIGIQQPNKFLVQENAFKVTAKNSLVEFDVNNTVKNRIIRGTGLYSVDGYRTDTIVDLNSYNDYPVARTIDANPQSLHTWELDNEKNPTVMRYSAAYAPVFKRIPMFLPYNDLTTGVNLIGKGNWRFYDTSYNTKKLQGFAQIDEVVLSKVNMSSNVLKLQNVDDRDKSIYPMVDEFGYDVDARFLFASTWEHGYYYSSRRIEIAPNTYPTAAGYTVGFNGKTDYLRIPDSPKFSLERFLVEDVNYNKPIYVRAWEALVTPPTGNTLLWNMGFGANVPLAAKASMGGYFRLVSESGDITTHRYKAQNWSDYADLTAKLNTTMGLSAYTATTTNNNNMLQFVNPTNFDFEPEYDTHITDGNSVVYVGTKTGGNGSTIKATVELKIYINQCPEVMRFSIISDTGVVTPVAVSTLTGSIKSSANVLSTALTAALTGFDVSTVTTTSDFYIISFQRTEAGSLHNFIIDVGEREYLMVNKLTTASVEKKVRSSFTKTSLKPVQQRTTGYLNDVTVEFWIKFNSPAKKWETIMYKGADTTVDVWRDLIFRDFTYIIGRYEKTEHLSFKTCHKQLNGSMETHNLVGKAALKADTWYHIACVSDSKARRKSIYLNGELDVSVANFIIGTKTGYVPDRELVYEFLRNRQRLLPGVTFNRIGSEVALAERIKANSTDASAQKWFDIIRGYRTLTAEDLADLEWQKQNWVSTMPEAYAVFKDNYASYGYYLTTTTGADWDILLATDSTAKLGARTLSGSLDELRVWNYARSRDQVRDNYRFISRVETHLNPLQCLVAYYRFDDGKDATTIKDLMDNHMVKEQSKWCYIRNEQVNRGKGAEELETVSYLYFEKSFFGGSSISVNTDSFNWVLSGADIAGYSDERYAIDVPARKVLNVAPVPAIRTSEYVNQSNEQIAASEANLFASIQNESRVVDNVPVTGKNDTVRTLLRFPRVVAKLFTAAAPVTILVNEELPPQIKIYDDKTGIVSAAPEKEQMITSNGVPNPVIRGDIRISNSQEGSNIFKKLFDYLTNRRSK